MGKKIVWRCPSNIAIVKYWGKRQNQIPASSSVSMTLTESYTEVELELSEKTKDGIELEYFFEDEKNEDFAKRILDYANSVKNQLPVLTESRMVIQSRNSFPHSAGIASSASSFGAISLALLDASFPGKYVNDRYEFLKRASFLARIGSGSACRSMFAPFSIWGKNKLVRESSDEYAIPDVDIHPAFRDVCDSILIVDSTPKKFSSSFGHSLMRGHPYARQRFEQGNRRTVEIIDILERGDWEKFIHLTESEALTLHAMMMTSESPYLLMKPGTLLAIEKIQHLRKEKGISVCFTLDAGPNVHVLYPSEIKDQVVTFLESSMTGIVNQIIHDKTGKGPEKLR